MATTSMSSYRAHEAEIPFRVTVITSVPRIEATGFDAEIVDPLAAARGILLGLLLCVPFWVGVYLLIF